MKKEKQARQDSKQTSRRSQPQKPAADAPAPAGGATVVVGFPKEAIPMLEHAARRENCTRSEFLVRALENYMGRHYLGALQGLDRPAAATPAPGRVHPFGPVEADGDVEAARIHIEEHYKACLKWGYGSGLSNLEALGICIGDNPKLATERLTIQAICAGQTPLVDLGNHAYAPNNYPIGGLTTVEMYLGCSLKNGEMTLEAVLALLGRMNGEIQKQCADKPLAKVVRGMLRGQAIMGEVRYWLDRPMGGVR